MFRHKLQKCLLTLCFFMMMCPKRSQLRLRYFPGYGGSRLDFSGITKEKEKLKDDTHDMTYLSAVPGFQYTDEEMKRLKLWPQGIIPYFIDDFSFDKVLRDDIRLVLKDANGYGGVHFVELAYPPVDDSRYVFFINRRGAQGCPDVALKDFTNTGVQKVVLGYDCMTYGDLAAIVLAIVGIPPQHNAPDRDMHIRVKFENIMPEKRYLYHKLNNNEWLFHELGYDYGSASHYDFHKYTVNGRATIEPNNPGQIPEMVEVGEPAQFSYYDMMKMRIVYNYISSKQNTEVPECANLFKPGTNFSRFEPETEDEMEPRPKPNKYLGRTDETIEINPNTTTKNDDAKSVTNYNSQNTNQLKQKSKKPNKNHQTDKLSKLSDYESDKTNESRQK